MYVFERIHQNFELRTIKNLFSNLSYGIVFVSILSAYVSYDFFLNIIYKITQCLVIYKSYNY